MNSVMVDWQADVWRLYAEVDAQVAAAGPRCEASGRCCRFKEYGHTLFLSHLEAEILLALAPAYTQPVDSAFCPFQQENLCTAREPRPLGCRIYFCDPNYQEASHQIMESALRTLKQLAETHNLGWMYAPLHQFLNEASREVVQKKEEPKSDLRIGLPVLHLDSHQEVRG